MSGLAISAAESRAEMVLDVTSAGVDRLLALVRLNALELGHDDLHGLANDIGQGVETATMSHTDHKSAGTLLHSRIDAEL